MRQQGDRRLLRRAGLAVIAGVLACGAAISLGNWQTRRAQMRQEVERQWTEVERQSPRLIDSAATLAAIERNLPARVRLRGRPEHQRSIWLDNRIVDGRPGLYLLTPVRLEDASGVVLLHRGWVARKPGADELPRVGEPEVIDVEGVAVPNLPRLLELRQVTKSSQLPAVWHNLDLDAARAATGLPLARFVVQQTSNTDDGLTRRWPRPPPGGAQKNRGYAFQWYAIAAVIAALTIFFGWRAFRPPAAARDPRDSA
jgi:surfeit locus 1 family protein